MSITMPSSYRRTISDFPAECRCLGVCSRQLHQVNCNQQLCHRVRFLIISGKIQWFVTV